MTLVLSIALAYLAALVIPGPNFLITVRNSLTYSRQSGLLTALGIGMGSLVHGTAGLMGVSVILAQSVWLYTLLKMAAAGYLVVIGLKALFSKSETHTFEGDSTTTLLTPAQAIRLGFLTCISNPKTALFFLSIFTTFITPQTTESLQLLVVLVMGLLAMTWYSVVSLSFSWSPIRAVYQRFEGGIRRSMGVLFIVLGVRVAR